MGLANDLGKGIGGIFSNPSVLLLAGLGIGLFIFRDPIQKAFANFGIQIGNLFSPAGAIQQAGADAGQAVFDAGASTGSAVFDAGEAFGDFIGQANANIQQQLDNFIKSFPSDVAVPVQNVTQDVSDSALKATEEGGPLSQLFDLITGGAQDDQFMGFVAGPEGSNINPAFQGPTQPIPEFEDLPFFQQVPLTGLAEVEPAPLPPQEGFGSESLLLGGGPSFIGGTTTFGDAIVDTLSEVLNIFPHLTASQARDALEEFPNLTANEFAQIDPDVINIIGAGNTNF